MTAVVVQNGARQDLNGGEPLLVPGAVQIFPNSHVVSKRNGQQLFIRWGVRNDGSVNGTAILDLRMIPPSGSGGQVLQTQPVPVTTGFPTTLTAIWIVSLPLGQSTGIIVMWDFTNNDFSKSLETHVFTVNVS